MNTKEAIKCLKSIEKSDGFLYKAGDIQANYQLKNDVNNIIELLQRGEKYEAILNELKEKYGKEHRFYAIYNERFCSGNEVIIYLSQTIFELEQKYFPKGETNE